MAIAPFAGRNFHSMFIASKPFHSHLPTTFAAKLRWLAPCVALKYARFTNICGVAAGGGVANRDFVYCPNYRRSP